MSDQQRPITPENTTAVLTSTPATPRAPRRPESVAGQLPPPPTSPTAQTQPSRAPSRTQSRRHRRVHPTTGRPLTAEEEVTQLVVANERLVREREECER